MSSPALVALVGYETSSRAIRYNNYPSISGLGRSHYLVGYDSCGDSANFVDEMFVDIHGDIGLRVIFGSVRRHNEPIVITLDIKTQRILEIGDTITMFLLGNQTSTLRFTTSGNVFLKFGSVRRHKIGHLYGCAGVPACLG